MTQRDRRTQIADAALRLIGTAGSRALTHRGVDAEAGLPEGSTSYYCRKRVDLLALALRRHAELELDALQQLGKLASLTSTTHLAAELARSLSAWMHVQTRAQLATRFELFLSAVHEPALLELLDASRGRFLDALQGVLEPHGVARPRSLAGAIIGLIEGLLLERVRSDETVVRTADLRRWLEALFAPEREAQDARGAPASPVASERGDR